MPAGVAVSVYINVTSAISPTDEAAAALPRRPGPSVQEPVDVEDVSFNIWGTQ